MAPRCFSLILTLLSFTLCAQTNLITPVTILPRADAAAGGILNIRKLNNADGLVVSTAAPQLNGDTLGGAFTIRGSSTTNGNILLQPGNVATNSSVFVDSTRLDTPGLIIRDASGTTTGNSLELRKADDTVFFKIIGSTDSGAPGAVVTKAIYSLATNTYPLGASTNRWSKIWTTDLDISGTCTGCGGYWSRTSTDLTTLTAGDTVSLGGSLRMANAVAIQAKSFAGTYYNLIARAADNQVYIYNDDISGGNIILRPNLTGFVSAEQSVLPATDSSIDLGRTGINRWRRLWLSNDVAFNATSTATNSAITWRDDGAVATRQRGAIVFDSSATESGWIFQSLNDSGTGAVNLVHISQQHARIGIGLVNPTVALDITGAGKFTSTVTTGGLIVTGAAPQLDASGLGSVLTIRGSSTTNGNILLQPGSATSGTSSVVAQAGRLNGPSIIGQDASGTTTANGFELQKADSTVYFKVIGGTDTGAPGTVVSADHVSLTGNTYKLGSTSNRWNKLWVTDIDMSGTCTGCPGGVSSVTASSPLASSGGSTPNITIQVATSSQNGYLSSTDWSTFNNKVATSRSISTNSPLGGGGDLSADRTLTCTTCVTTGSTSSMGGSYTITGNLYLRTFSGGDANCSGVADGWAGIRTDTNELQVCISSAVKKGLLI